MIVMSRTWLLPVLVGMSGVTAQEAEQSPWSYKSGQMNSPPFWGKIEDIENNDCGGDMQSPIDFVPTDCGVFADFEFMPGDCTLEQIEFKISDHNVEVDYEDGCTKDMVKFPDLDLTFELIQFHIHTGTEHTFDSFLNAAELHLVHQDIGDSGTLAVVGVLIQVGLAEDQPFFAQLLEGWKAVAAETEEICGAPDLPTRRLESSEQVEEHANKKQNLKKRKLQNEVLGIYDIIPDGEAFYRYEGSLTTPPCTEIVHWAVADKPLQISTTEELELVELILGYQNPLDCSLKTVASDGGSTSRPQQPLNGREVTLYCPGVPETVEVTLLSSPPDVLALSVDEPLKVSYSVKNLETKAATFDMSASTAQQFFVRSSASQLTVAAGASAKFDVHLLLSSTKKCVHDILDKFVVTATDANNAAVTDSEAVNVISDCGVEPPKPPVTIIDFSTMPSGKELKNGKYVKDEWYAKYGLTITASAKKGGYTPGGKARIFDTTIRSDEDPDLNSPNEACKPAGSGQGEGGKPGMPGANCSPNGEGNVLIIQESKKDEPDDNAHGGKISFHFKRLVTIYELGVMDLEGPKNYVVVKKAGRKNDLKIKFKGLGDNSVQTVSIDERGVEELTLVVPYSAGVRFITFSLDGDDDRVYTHRSGDKLLRM